MSTRSNIAIELEDKTIKLVYCHSDGYISGVGKTLLNNYKNYDDVLKLINHGGISSLADNLNDTSFYCRDWGRKNEDKPMQYNNEFCMMYDMTGATMIEYLYLFKNNDWYVSKSHYIKKSKLNKNAYDVGLCYWTNFQKVSKFKKELSDNVQLTEKQMIANIGSMLKASFGDNVEIQGQKVKSKREVN